MGMMPQSRIAAAAARLAAPQARGSRPPFRPGAPRPGGSRPPARTGGGRGPGGPGGRGPGLPGGPGGPRFPMGSGARTAVVVPKPPLTLPNQATVSELAALLHVSVPEVIKVLITKANMMANINQALGRETMEMVAIELGFEIAEVVPEEEHPDGKGDASNLLDRIHEQRKGDVTQPRPPIVTVMGHVDHGKTSLLDVIRQTNVTASEAGGITQHIGAYQVEKQGRKITFLDTPGHEAFTAMRARGAQTTDVAVIVVAADDGVMPQTREAIDHAQAAGVPMVIAINKMDVAGANPDRVKQQLAEAGVFVEGYGGDVVSIAVSARQKKGIDDLLEMILIVSDLEEPRANADRPASGVIVESRKDPTRGPIATALVLDGTLAVGDAIIVGTSYGKIRAMTSDTGKMLRKAEPSTPVSILGLPEVKAGEPFQAVKDERVARAIAEERQLERPGDTGRLSLEDLAAQARAGESKELNLIIKADVQGSLEAIRHAVERIEVDGVRSRIIHMGQGNISQSDILLALASRAIVVGFHVNADPTAREAAERAKVDIRSYEIIYKLTEDIELALRGMRDPTYQDVMYGHAEVRQLFRLPSKVVIAGCRVTDGQIVRNAGARVLRGGELAFDGRIVSLKHLKDDVREVGTGFDCGIGLEGFNDFQEGDVIEAFGRQQVE